MFLDSDDWIDTDTVEQAAAKISEQNADLVMWSYIREFPDKKIEKHIFDCGDKIFEGEELKALHKRIAGLTGRELANPENADSAVTAWGKLYKTSLFNDNNIQCAHPILEDVMLWMQTAYYAQAVATIPQTVQTYRRRAGSICRSPWATPQRQSLLRQIRADLAAFAHSHPAKGMRRTHQRMQQILSALTVPSTHAAPTAPGKNDISSP